MREILFRGQTRRKGQKVWMDGSPVESNWVYGGICHGTGDFSVIYGNLDEERERPTEKWVVYTDTVGQFTGLTDKNGKKIFEGDIVRYTELCFGGEYLPVADVVEFSEGGFATHHYFLNNWLRNGMNGNTQLQGIEVIGNIHDNPELLGGET